MINNVTLCGRATKQPELRYTQSGVAVAAFTLAVERNVKNQQTGERETDFINIVVWRQLAELCANYIKKGDMAAVKGRIQTRNYDNSQDQKVYITEILADEVQFLGGKKEEGNQSSNQHNNPFSNPFTGSQQPIDIDSDDLPF